MIILFLILLVLAAACFFAAAFDVASRFNLVAVGLFLWVLVPLIQLIRNNF
jgi:hypothetical protein